LYPIQDYFVVDPKIFMGVSSLLNSKLQKMSVLTIYKQLSEIFSGILNLDALEKLCTLTIEFLRKYVV